MRVNTLAGGVVGLAPGLAWLPAARSLVAADAHFAYEDVTSAPRAKPQRFVRHRLRPYD